MAGLSLFIAFLLILLAPFVFFDLMTYSLAKLHLSPAAATAITVSIFVGGLINIPIRRVRVQEAATLDPLDVFGLGGLSPQWRIIRNEMVIAVNVGGCLIPAALALYQSFHLAIYDISLLARVCLGAGINTILCYAFSRPVPKVGIVMPGLVSPLAAASLALILAPSQAAPAAFIIGVAGPLLGADLLHMRSVSRIGAGMVSIGGAGTFDGIVLSAIVAAYLV